MKRDIWPPLSSDLPPEVADVLATTVSQQTLFKAGNTNSDEFGPGETKPPSMNAHPNSREEPKSSSAKTTKLKVLAALVKEKLLGIYF